MTGQNHIHVRPLTQADEPFLWELLYLAIYVPEGALPPPPDIVNRPELARYVQGWGRPGDLGFAAIEAEIGLPVGAAWLRLLTGEERGYGYVDDSTPEMSIALLPKYRRQGLGTQLIRRLFEAAQEHYPAISLSVSRENPAFRLYLRLGFNVVGQLGKSITMKISFES